jgi:hypothetical protein
MHKKSQVKKIYWEFSRIFTVQHRNLFQDSNFPKSYLPQIRGSSWHNNETKMIRRGHYSSNNFQNSNKRKSTENKTLGYLSRVLFFNVFELGAVIWKDAHVGVIKELKAKAPYKNLKQERASKSKCKIHLNLNHFLCIVIL